MSEASQGLTRAVVGHARAIALDAIPDEALEATRHCLLDFVGCALAGAREDLTNILVDEVVAPEASAQTTLLGRAERATAQTAALVNGCAGHALDYDDTHTGMGGHPSVPVIPALLAAAEATDAAGADFVAALVAGFELQARVGRIVGNEHYVAGFHTTGTVGTFGAAAACAHLYGLDEAAWLHAIGLAGTQAAGLKSGFGTMAKPMHAGRAASAGYLAATLAKGGFTSNPEILEVDQGFVSTHTSRDFATEQLAEMADRWFVRETLFKYHAACYLTHSSIESVARLRDEHGLDAGNVDAIDITVNPGLLRVCNIPEPTTGLEGKFSLRATAALALLAQETDDPATFCDEVIQSDDVIAVQDRVTIACDENVGTADSRVVIESRGARHETSTDTGQPSADLAIQRGRLEAKFDRLATPVIGNDRAKGVRETILRIESAPSVRDLLADLRAN